ncbi:MAG TPA: T9SS type A sorting domain-containing protein [Flavobacteriales bacterium]|nr:T9SS type A sorting domain-containing protein [Flavobacteriales bacterium]
MRALPLFALTVAALHVQGQLTNGSFELGLSAWEWTCGDPELFAGGAPGAGDQHASKEMGQTQGCFPSYLFQRLNGVQDGDLLTIGGWLRTPGDFVPVYPQFGLGTISNGIIQLEESVGSSWYEWSYLEITDTLELQSGDTAILVLSSGLIGGPAIQNPGYFDGFTMSFALAFHESAVERPSILLDRASNSLYASMGSAMLLQARLFDLTGRHLPARGNVRSNTARIDLNGLPIGVYLVALRTADGERVVRFVME